MDYNSSLALKSHSENKSVERTYEQKIRGSGDLLQICEAPVTIFSP